MRYYEFITEESIDNGLDSFITLLKNFVGRYTSKGVSAPLNWKTIASIAKKSNFEVLGDPVHGYETFKSIWDNDPKAKALLEPIVKNFNEKGIELNIPGAPDAEKEPTQGPEQDSQAEVDKIAASAAPQQLAQSQA